MKINKLFFYPLLIAAIWMSVYSGICSIERTKTEKMLTALESAKIECGRMSDGTTYIISDRDIKSFAPSVNGKKMKKETKDGQWIWTN